MGKIVYIVFELGSIVFVTTNKDKAYLKCFEIGKVNNYDPEDNDVYVEEYELED